MRFSWNIKAISGVSLWYTGLKIFKLQSNKNGQNSQSNNCIMWKRHTHRRLILMFYSSFYRSSFLLFSCLHRPAKSCHCHYCTHFHQTINNKLMSQSVLWKQVEDSKLDTHMFFTRMMLEIVKELCWSAIWYVDNEITNCWYLETIFIIKIKTGPAGQCFNEVINKPSN